MIDWDLPWVRAALPLLLADKSTERNIIWATDTYAELGASYMAEREIYITQLFDENGACRLQPRVTKANEAQKSRTRKHAEVFTPAWIVNRMNNFCDESFFGRTDAFNMETERGWTAQKDPVVLPKKKKWTTYVDRRGLEITCGEAPFLTSRYDAASGEVILIENRIGLLDRKLRLVRENAADAAEWLKWAFRALESTYGYEFPAIIYQIATHYILGFAEELGDIKHNFRLLDALPYAKEGTLEEKLDEVFG